MIIKLNVEVSLDQLSTNYLEFTLTSKKNYI